MSLWNLPFPLQLVQPTNISGWFCGLQRSGPPQIWHLFRSLLSTIGTGFAFSKLAGFNTFVLLSSASTLTSVSSPVDDSSLELLESCGRNFNTVFSQIPFYFVFSNTDFSSNLRKAYAWWSWEAYAFDTCHDHGDEWDGSLLYAVAFQGNKLTDSVRIHISNQNYSKFELGFTFQPSQSLPPSFNRLKYLEWEKFLTSELSESSLSLPDELLLSLSFPLSSSLM